MTSQIPGVVIKKLNHFKDSRGWLSELYREDELPEGFHPVMGYLSVTHPGIARGPHEHMAQSDCFCFMSGKFRLTLWVRSGNDILKETHETGEDNAMMVIVPPGVVHAYENIGDQDAFVLNFPDRLYGGKEKKEPVDEIRHEERDSEFKL